MVAVKELPLLVIFKPHNLIFETLTQNYADKFRFVNSWDSLADLSRFPGVDTTKAIVCKCLVHGDIAGAALDVFDNEPDVPKELLELDNVVLSPHRALHMTESFSQTCELVLANLEAFFSNKPLAVFVAD